MIDNQPAERVILRRGFFEITGEDYGIIASAMSVESGS
jgi:hypothetical protein